MKVKKHASFFWTFAIFAVALIIGCSNAPTGHAFSDTYAELALAKNEIPTVVQSHPRLFIRQSPWKSGPNVEDLRKWSKIEPLKSYLKRRPWNPKPGIEWAFRYLVTGDEKLVPPIVNRMKSEKGYYWPGWLATLAIEYDWLYNSRSFSDEDKRVVEDKMVAWANSAVKYGEKYHDMWSHFGYRPVTDLAAAGLALYGHRPEAEKFIAMAGGYMEKVSFPGWRLNDGAWQGGWCYYGQGAAGLFGLVAMWSSATDQDLYGLIEGKQGDWLRKHLDYLVSTVYPDGTPMETTGFSYSPYRPGVLNTILKLTRAYNDPNGIDCLKKAGLDKVPWWAGIGQFIYYTPEMRRKTKGRTDIPLTQIWGKKGVGYVQMRSGWGKGDTIIDFKCGDYFWSHQFQNQGSFTIYRKGKLAIQSGVYDAYWGDHMQFYYRPTIGSNSMLVIQPGEASWIPPNVAKRYGIPNKNGYFKEWGGQRICYMIPKYGSAETCFTFDKYLYRKDHEHHFETGDIKAYEVTDRYSYVYGNTTAAYNNPHFSYPGNKPKLDLFTREMVFLDKKYIVVFDRVNALDPDYQKRWLLHSIGEPQINSSALKTEKNGHIETYGAGLVRIDNEEGTLFCQTMFPKDYYVRKVGGCATVTEAKPDPTNKGDAILSTRIHGKYERLSNTIASDRAKQEQWVIEFIDDTHFKATGSSTGEDGIGAYKGKKSAPFISKSQSLFIPAQNWKGKPQKGDTFYFSVASPSYRFWVSGKNHAPIVKKVYQILKDGSRVDPGNWRIEVFPRKPRKFDTFLHLLYPCDRDKAAPPGAKGIITLRKIMKGIRIDNWLVLFGYKGRVDEKVEYLIKNERKTANLLLDMVPEKPYMINIIGGSFESRKQRIVASKEGTLFFTTPGKCRVEITPL